MEARRNVPGIKLPGGTHMKFVTDKGHDLGGIRVKRKCHNGRTKEVDLSVDLGESIHEVEIDESMAAKLIDQEMRARSGNERKLWRSQSPAEFEA